MEDLGSHAFSLSLSLPSRGMTGLWGGFWTKSMLQCWEPQPKHDITFLLPFGDLLSIPACIKFLPLRTVPSTVTQDKML